MVNCEKSTIRIIGNNIRCCCCYDEISTDDILDCGHCLCLECAKSLNDITCPLCRKTLGGKNITNGILSAINDRKQIERIRTGVGNRIISILSQDVSNNMYNIYRLNPNIIFDSSLQALYGSNPLDWIKNRKLFYDGCSAIYNNIIEDYPQMKGIPDLSQDIAESYSQSLFSLSGLAFPILPHT